MMEKQLSTTLNGMLQAAAQLLLPDRCVACSTLIQGSWPFCGLCSVSVHQVERPCLRCGLPDAAPLCGWCRAWPPPFAAARAPLVYGGQAAVAVRRAKYGGMSHLCRPLGQLLRLCGGDPGGRLVVPVPLHPRRLRQRGFNQATLLARQLAPRPGQPGLDCRALTRVQHTPSQAALDRHQRLDNLRQAFAASRPRVGGHRVLLVDDVMTTGATATACAETLLGAGAVEVQVLTLTRAESPD